MSENPSTPPTLTRNKPNVSQEEAIKFLQDTNLPDDIINQVKDYYGTRQPSPPAIERAERQPSVTAEQSGIAPTRLFNDNETEGGRKSKQSRKSKKSRKTRKSRKSRKSRK